MKKICLELTKTQANNVDIGSDFTSNFHPNYIQFLGWKVLEQIQRNKWDYTQLRYYSSELCQFEWRRSLAEIKIFQVSNLIYFYFDQFKNLSSKLYYYNPYETVSNYKKYITMKVHLCW